MNICFLFGKIITIPEYYFYYHSKKHIAMISFEIKQKNNIIKIKAYDNMADYIYRTLNKDDFILIEGRLEKDMYINVLQIEKVF